MRLSLGNQILVRIPRFEKVEKDAALIEGLDVRDEVLGITIDEAVGGSHMEEETVADEFGGGIVIIRTEEHIGADAPQRGRTMSVRIQFGHNGRRLSHRRQYHRYAFYLHGHTDDGRVEVVAEERDERGILGLQVFTEALLLGVREAPLAFG